ncbi:MAG: radical SAM protein [Lachnospiraceae bacterium]|nr:radical SAM protein [Lachnospiraceae bacterium]
MDQSVSFMPKIFCEPVENGRFKKNYHLYIHIPFCKRKCTYCGININTSFEDFDLYVSALEKELVMIYEQNICIQEFQSIHIGGGTPSLMTLHQMKGFFGMLNRLIKNFEDIEKVIESNPESLSDEKIKYLSSINNVTLSIGIQSLNSKVLHSTCRMIDENEVINILKKVKIRPFLGVGADVICGLPFSTKEIFLSDISRLVTLGIDHLSIYPLWIEKESILGKNYEKYKEQLMNDNQKEQCLVDAQKVLFENGYKKKSVYHYCKENKKLFIYGNSQILGDEWIGIGASAISFFNNTKVENIICHEKYLMAIKDNKLPILNQYKYSFTEILINKFAYAIRNPVIIIDEEKKQLGEIGFKLFTKFINKLKNMDFVKETNLGWEITNKGTINIGMIDGIFIKNILMEDTYE